MSNQPNVNVNVNGIGIINFLKHKSFLVIGSTGFVAKVFVEKLLREVPEVHKVYLLIRAKNAKDAHQRLQSQIIECELFKRLKEEHGERYEEFMGSKLVAVVGNICDQSSRLGMDADMAHLVADKIDVIINSAGNTSWHERYDVLLDVNVRGLSRLLSFAMDCKKPILFLHISTVAVGSQTGIAFEKHVSRNDSGLDIDLELKIVTKLSSSSIPNHKLSAEMSKLGMRRAKFHGYADTYQMTKAMGEIILSSNPREKLSIVIVRPPYIKSTFKEPFPGWIEGYRGMDPLILSYGKGQLQGILANPTTVLDIVPVDMVVNSMMAVIANHGIMGKSGVYIYQIATSLVNPVSCQRIFDSSRVNFTLHPLHNLRGEVIKVKDIEYYSSMDEYILVGLDDLSSSNIHLKKLVRMAAIYGQAMFATWRMDINNTQNLFERMSWEEKNIFNFDVKRIDWEDYFKNIHIPGLRKYILKEKFPVPKL